jgi:hypothetical protein
MAFGTRTVHAKASRHPANVRKTLAVGVVVSAVLAWSLLSGSAASAATMTASSCSASAVQAAINAAADNDIVAVPAGSCTWSAPVTLPSTKTLTLRGAGIDVTRITASGTAVRMGDAGVGSDSRVTGFTFIGAGVEVDGDGWRVDHIKVTGPNGGLVDGVFANGRRRGVPYGPTGLVDHNQFVNARVLVFGYPDYAVNSATLTASPLGLGDGNAVYVEDSTFTFQAQPNVIDCNYAGRFVFRYNTVTNSSVDAHSVQGWNRACRRWEVYENTIQLVNAAYFTPIFIRGGTGVIFDNTITGSWSEPFISFDNVRSFDNRSSWFPIDQTHPGVCNGSSPWDGIQAANGWPCRDQIGRGRDNWQWTSGNPYPSQTSEPAYLWGNTMNGAPAQVRIRNNSGNWIQAGRDYVNGTPRPGYVPLAYPHPMSTGGSTPTPPPPPAAPTLNFSASPTSVVSGGTSTLTWSAANATSCTASNSGAGGTTWNGSKPTSGSDVRGPLTATATYSLSCTGPGGTVSRSVTVTVTPAPPPSFTLTVQASGPGTVAINGCTTLNCVSCAASFVRDSQVTLVPQPQAGARFVGWTGGGCSGTGSCTVRVTQATTVTARFTTP